jgi:hypothetical protein
VQASRVAERRHEDERLGRDAADLVPAPHWQTLPEEVRLTLTGLMVRLILDHATDARAPHLTEARHDA